MLLRSVALLSPDDLEVRQGLVFMGSSFGGCASTGRSICVLHPIRLGRVSTIRGHGRIFEQAGAGFSVPVLDYYVFFWCVASDSDLALCELPLGRIIASL